MTNSEIVDLLELTGRLMELHDRDAFKTRSYQTAAFNLDKSTADLANLPVEELVKLQGVGKSVAQKIREIAETGRLTELDELLAQTPEGVLDMFRIKGLGVKKVRTLWRELGIDNLRDLQRAGENGEIAKIKGFGASTQEKILAALEFLQEQQGKVRMDKAALIAKLLDDQLSAHFERVEISGQVRRKAQEVDTVQLLVQTNDPLSAMLTLQSLPNLEQNQQESSPFVWRGKLAGFDVQVELLLYPAEQMNRQLFIQTATESHLQQVGAGGASLLQVAYSSVLSEVATGTTDELEKAIYARAGLPYIVPEMREDAFAFRWAANHQSDELVTWDDLRGTLHNHSTWSDGKQSVADMAAYCRELGLTYFGIADHSKTASYANGLDADRVRQQQAEIDQLNAGFGADFHIFKGIESDILGDGSLDYDDATLATFDYVVASVHQTLTMSLEKATTRLLKAIENPYTTILGHPTGRLLLAREGYPIDHRAIIDACAEHNVVIEINASPYRLDIDWRWIDYAMQQGVMLSINPDAHDLAGLLDMHYGVAVGRKGGLTKAMTFNALTLQEMTDYLQRRRERLRK
ncbi:MULTISPECIES: helix-hairpin-helix domain-containing protein [unclassified Spirosoma]|uniref:helix-hairpin-helix domain-containing protein n=1 Tax=unclassified Spirosoma TaxID=2621999 RepID=UPI00095B7EA9|nr:MULTISPECIES: helix-hairpin-helix domain-containing protein [unclassified Spirosoma]MBN8822623.1 DNA polymerase/3'-5' exonuclease PolX [Spirosoma sp.]OJW74113.1 MAG: DNA polymerase/3'-5' exonuclease PolX [Spirosoma sp. 48-14]